MATKCTVHQELFSIHVSSNVLGHIAYPVIMSVTNHVDHHVPDGHQKKSETNVLMPMTLPLHHLEPSILNKYQ